MSSECPHYDSCQTALSVLLETGNDSSNYMLGVLAQFRCGNTAGVFSGFNTIRRQRPGIKLPKTDDYLNCESPEDCPLGFYANRAKMDDFMSLPEGI